MKGLCISIFICAVLKTASAQVQMSGVVQNIPQNAVRKAALEYLDADTWKAVVNIQLDTAGYFKVEFNPPVTGQYRIKFPSSNLRLFSEFVVDKNSGSKVLSASLDYQTMNGGPLKISGDAETEAYYDLSTEYNHVMTLRDSLGNSNPQFIENIQASFNKKCETLISQHRGWYTADVVCKLMMRPLRSEYPNEKNIFSISDSAFLREHALDKINFYDDRVLHHNAFIRSLERYYKLHYKDGATDYAFHFIDGIMMKGGGNETVDAFLFKYLLDKMIDFRNEPGLSYLLQNYAPDCAEDNTLPATTKNLVEALNNCTPGKPCPDAALPDLNGKVIQIAEVCAKNKMTLLLFWRTTCSHCEEFKPTLEKFYEQYHADGFEVFAISMDKEETEWKKFIGEHQEPWINVFIPKEQRNIMSRKFPAASTPTLIALDRDMNVVSRLIIRSRFQQFMEENFPRMK